MRGQVFGKGRRIGHGLTFASPRESVLFRLSNFPIYPNFKKIAPCCNSLDFDRMSLITWIDGDKTSFNDMPQEKPPQMTIVSFFAPFIAHNADLHQRTNAAFTLQTFFISNPFSCPYLYYNYIFQGLFSSSCFGRISYSTFLGQRAWAWEHSKLRNWAVKSQNTWCAPSYVAKVSN